MLYTVCLLTADYWDVPGRHSDLSRGLWRGLEDLLRTSSAVSETDEKLQRLHVDAADAEWRYVMFSGRTMEKPHHNRTCTRAVLNINRIIAKKQTDNNQYTKMFR